MTKPTADELERLLHSEDDTPVRITPGGQVVGVNDPDPPTYEEQIERLSSALRAAREAIEEVQASFILGGRLRDIADKATEAIDAALAGTGESHE